MQTRTFLSPASSGLAGHLCTASNPACCMQSALEGHSGISRGQTKLCTGTCREMGKRNSKRWQHTGIKQWPYFPSICFQFNLYEIWCNVEKCLCEQCNNSKTKIAYLATAGQQFWKWRQKLVTRKCYALDHPSSTTQCITFFFSLLPNSTYVAFNAALKLFCSNPTSAS